MEVILLHVTAVTLKQHVLLTGPVSGKIKETVDSPATVSAQTFGCFMQHLESGIREDLVILENHPRALGSGWF